jgi:hypothetical protein
MKSPFHWNGAFPASFFDGSQGRERRTFGQAADPKTTDLGRIA